MTESTYAMAPTSFSVATTNSLSELLRLSQELHSYSDEELHGQIVQLVPEQPEQLLPLLRLLLHNTHCLRQQLVFNVPIGSLPAPTVPLRSPLSAREQEILALVARGYTLPQIGAQLFISPATVNNHCARMREKLNLHGRNALIIYASGSKIDYKQRN